MNVLVTGAAGFIGFHVARKLLARGDRVVGLDNLNDYYDVNLKLARLAQIENLPGFTFAKMDLQDRPAMEALFDEHQFDAVINLAAQAGVRYSLVNPHAYTHANVEGQLVVLEMCRGLKNLKHLVYASSSSVYGASTKLPFSVEDRVDAPVSLYAATKKSGELMAHCYSHLYRIPATGLRFFTVYGPWGRPDMALFRFTKGILAGEPIPVFNEGRMIRDFTYIDDIVEGVIRTLDHLPQPNPDWSGDHPDSATSTAPYRIYNIGNNEPVELMRYIEVLEESLGRKAEKNMLPLQPGDVPDTWADTADLAADVGYQPSTPVEEGVRRFVEWYLEYYRDELKESA